MLSHPSCNLDTHQMIKLQRVGTLTTIPREFNEEEKKKAGGPIQTFMANFAYNITKRMNNMSTMCSMLT